MTNLKLLTDDSHLLFQVLIQPVYGFMTMLQEFNYICHYRSKPASHANPVIFFETLEQKSDKWYKISRIYAGKMASPIINCLNDWSDDFLSSLTMISSS